MLTLFIVFKGVNLNKKPPPVNYFLLKIKILLQPTLCLRLNRYYYCTT